MPTAELDGFPAGLPQVPASLLPSQRPFVPPSLSLTQESFASVECSRTHHRCPLVIYTGDRKKSSDRRKTCKVGTRIWLSAGCRREMNLIPKEVEQLVFLLIIKIIWELPSWHSGSESD